MRNRVAVIFSIIALVLSVWIPKGVQAANPPQVNIATVSDLFGKRGQLIVWRGTAANLPGSQAVQASPYLIPEDPPSKSYEYAAGLATSKASFANVSINEFPTFVAPGSIRCTSSGIYKEPPSALWYLSGNQIGSKDETIILDFDWRGVPATSGGNFFNLDCVTGAPGTVITPNPTPPTPPSNSCPPVVGAKYVQSWDQLPTQAQLIIPWGGSDSKFLPPPAWQGINTRVWHGLGNNCLMLESVPGKGNVIDFGNSIGKDRAATNGGTPPPTLIWAPQGWNDYRSTECTEVFTGDSTVIIADTKFGDNNCFNMIEYHDTQFVVPPPPPPPSVFRLFVPMVTLGGPQSICPDQSGWIPEIGFTKYEPPPSTKNDIPPSTWYLITGNYPTQPPGVNFWLRLRSADQTQWITQIGFTPMNGGQTVYDSEIYRGYAIPGDMTFIAKSNVQAGSVSIRITIRNLLYGDCSRFFIVKVDDGAPPLS